MRNPNKNNAKSHKIIAIGLALSVVFTVYRWYIFPFDTYARAKAYRLAIQYCDDSNEFCSCVTSKYILGLTDAQIIRINNGISVPDPMFGCGHFAKDCFK